MLDHFAALGLPKTATEEDIKKAYRHLAKLCHPDRDRTEGAEDRFKALSKAYTACLSLSKAEVKSVPGKPITPGWVGSDVTASLPVSLHDIISCAKKSVSVKRVGYCKQCDATGSKTKETSICKHCGGKGLSGIDLILGHKKRCKYCGGPGKIPKEPRCSFCGGSGLVPEMFQCEVVLNPHAVIIVLEGEGNRCSGGVPGKLLIEIDIGKNKDMSLFGLDIKTFVKVSPAEAVLGKEIIKDILGEQTVIQVPSGVSDGTVLSFPGKGVKYQGKEGNLKIKVSIEVPTEISIEEEVLYQKIIQIERDRLWPKALKY